MMNFSLDITSIPKQDGKPICGETHPNSTLGKLGIVARTSLTKTFWECQDTYTVMEGFCLSCRIQEMISLQTLQIHNRDFRLYMHKHIVNIR